MKIQNWPIEKIKPYPGNAKKHLGTRIKASITNFGFDQPIVVDSEGTIIKGHGRYEAACELKMKTVPVIVRADLSADQVKIARIADNRSHEGGWDYDKLEKDLQAVNMAAFDFDLGQLGMDEKWWRKQQCVFAENSVPLSVPKETGQTTAIKSSFELTKIIMMSQETAQAWEIFKRENGILDDSVAFKKLLLGK